MKEWIYLQIIFIAESMDQFTNRNKEQGNGKYISHFKFPTHVSQNISRLCHFLNKKFCFWTLENLKKLKDSVNGTLCWRQAVISNKSRGGLSLFIVYNSFTYFIILNKILLKEF